MRISTFWISVLGVAIGTTNQPHADESGDMLASSRVPDVDVYADVTALKLSHVFRTELSSLEVTETTIPLIQVLKRAYNVIPTCPIWWWLQKTKLYDTYQRGRVPWCLMLQKVGM